MNSFVGALLLVAGASLAVVTQTHHLSWLMTLAVLLLLFPVGLAAFFGAEEKARVMAGKWWIAVHGWFLGQGGWSLWEAVTLGVVFFGLFAGAAFLGQPLLILAGILAPWLAGLWASRRGTQLPALLSSAAGALVGLAEGPFFLAWMPMELRDFPVNLVVLALACLIGAALGFWACARGQFRLSRQGVSQKQ